MPMEWASYCPTGGWVRWEGPRTTGTGWGKGQAWQTRANGTGGWSCGGAAHSSRSWPRPLQGVGSGPSGCAARARPQSSTLVQVAS